jgi:DNA helicase-2/ATP-dependent DNA helicase PcrA
MTTEEILSGLNEDQKQVVLDYNGPRFVVAGPGAGKTFTIVTMAQYMIHQGIPGKSIMMFTFTNKAAKEIKERVVSKIGRDGQDITIGTYHSTCSMILRRYADEIGFSKKFTIFDEQDTIGVIKKFTKGTDFDHHKMRGYIGDCKNKMISPTRALQNAQTNNSF